MYVQVETKSLDGETNLKLKQVTEEEKRRGIATGHLADRVCVVLL
jgi:magnesium-transporting ATPase (P-type)